MLHAAVARNTSRMTRLLLKQGASVHDVITHDSKKADRATTATYRNAKDLANVFSYPTTAFVGELPSRGGSRRTASHLDIDQPPRRAWREQA